MHSFIPKAAVDITARRFASLDPARAVGVIGGGAGGGEGSATGGQGVVATLQPPWIQATTHAVDYFVQSDGIALPAVAGSLTVAPNSLTVSAGYRAVIASMSIFVDAPTTLLDVDFMLRVNGDPVPGFTVRSYPRAATNLSIEFSGSVRVPQNAKIDVLIRNNSANAWTVGCNFTGWQWPLQEELRLFGDLFQA